METNPGIHEPAQPKHSEGITDAAQGAPIEDHWCSTTGKNVVTIGSYRDFEEMEVKLALFHVESVEFSTGRAGLTNPTRPAGSRVVKSKSRSRPDAAVCGPVDNSCWCVRLHWAALGSQAGSSCNFQVR